MLKINILRVDFDMKYDFLFYFGRCVEEYFLPRMIQDVTGQVKLSTLYSTPDMF